MRLLSLVCAALITASAQPAQVQHLKVTILSTMLSDYDGVGEWGFSALVEADGNKFLVDTGYHPETVLRNARDLHIDLSGVREVVLTHHHDDHTGGLMALRAELRKTNPAALSVAHVATGIFYSRPSPDGSERNIMIAARPKYEATGGKFVEHDRRSEIFPGVWLTGPIARVFPERNWTGSGKVRTPAGLVEDNIPEDQSILVNTPQGLVVITGCGHAGIVNILTAAGKPAYAVIGGIHLFAAKDEQVDWTAAKMKSFGVHYLIGAHCTGIESLYRLRTQIGLTRQTAVVGAVGATFVLGEGIHPGGIAQ